MMTTIQVHTSPVPPPSIITIQRARPSAHPVLQTNMARLDTARTELESTITDLRNNAGALAEHRVHVVLLIEDLQRALTRLNSVHGSLDYHLNTPKP